MKSIKILFVVIITASFWSNNSIAQSNIGLPIIKNYSKEIYNAGLQSWEIKQDQSGLMYFANNNGLLTFDGANWATFQVENKTIVRSILIDGERIYVGSQGDFGYFTPNKKGVLIYTSLKHLIKEEYQNFADVWDIVKVNQQIYFRTTNKIFTYNGKINIFDSNKTFEFLKQVENRVYLQDNIKGLSIISNNQKTYLPNTTIFNDKMVTDIIPFQKSKFLISTLKHGLYLYDGKNTVSWTLQDKGTIKQNRINCLTAIDNERISVGTLTGGLFIIDTIGQVWQTIDINKGLQSNDILSIKKDGLGNLWLALNNGIDYIEINSPFSLIEPDGDLRGTGYDVKIHNDKIYFGMSNGLYAADWKQYYNPFNTEQFQLLNNTKGQVWNLNIHNNQLLLGHHEGTFKIDGTDVFQISNLPGTWTSVSLEGFENQLLEGNYNGINLYSFQNGNWKFDAKVDNMLDESCRIIAQDEDKNIWISHPYRGIYKIELDVENKRVKKLKLYNSKNGFPSDYINVFRIGDGVVFAAENGIYEYNPQIDGFALSSKWLELIDSTSQVQRMIEDKMGNIWFVINEEIGVFWVKDFGIEKKLEKQVFPQLNGKLVGGFENIYPYDDENIFFPLERGFVHFNPTKYDFKDSLFFTHLQHVKLGDSSLVYGGWKSKKLDIEKFEYFQNSFTFAYSATDYSDFYTTEFQYLLEGLDDDWSAWSTKTLKEYTNLPVGTYSFKIRAKNANGQITKVESFDFKIAPPWYASTPAKVIYFLIGIGILLGLIFIPQRQFQQEKAILQQEQEKTLQEKAAEHQKIVAENQAEISKLQQDKLQAEIQFKNQELASTTMHLVQKGEFMNKLKDELTKILGATNEPKTKKEIRRTIKLLNENAQLDEDWQQFSQYFDEVHEDFLKRLRKAYPQLTPKDQRLCTYLKMNLSTKEIAPLMNISVRGVEVSRYRLRKKMELSTETNLNEFMMAF